ncbi:MAG: hypothetical protein IPJ58_19155 [Ardenticatenia bacterium]|nr:hypothetical protein [Ardenticatenia bacterium]
MNPRLLVGLLAMGLAITLQNNGAISAQVACVPVLDHMEITQAVQHDPCAITGVPPCSNPPGGPTGQIALRDRRMTTVRMYVKPPAGCPNQTVPQTDSRLSISDNGSGIGLYNFVWNSDNGPIAAHQPVWNRALASETLNFTFFPYNWQGTGPHTIQFRACVGLGATAYDVGSNCEWSAPITRIFTPRTSPDFAGVEIHYKGLLPESANAQEEEASRPLRAMLPLQEDGDGGYRLLEIPLVWPASDVENMSRDGLKVRMDNYFNNMGDASPDYLYGWLNDDAMNLANAGGWGWPEQPIAFGYSDEMHKQIYIHELGHNFDFLHEEFGPTIDSPGLSIFGWDVLDRMQAGIDHKEPNSYEVMSNRWSPGGNDQWIDPLYYTSPNIPAFGGGPELPPPSLMSGTPTSQTFMSVPVFPPSGGGTWSIGRIFDHQATMLPIVPEMGGAGRLDILDGQQNVLFSTTFDSRAICAGCAPTSLAATTIRVPQLPQAETAKVYYNAQLQDSRLRSSHAPAVTMISPTQGSTLGSQLTVSWNATDADLDSLRASVAISRDGAKWFPIGTLLDTNSVVVDTAKLPSGNTLRTRVSVSDGFNVTTAEVTGLVLGPNRNPVPVILSPAPNTVLRRGALLSLVGNARDVEDDELSGGSLSWYSNVDGYLGSGSALSVVGPASSLGTFFSAGPHTVELRATDSQGATSSDFVTITVQ